MKKLILRFLTIVLLAFLIKAIDTVYLFDKIQSIRFYIDLGQIAFVIGSCWFIVYKISSILDNYIKWDKSPERRLFTQLIATTFIVVIAMYVLFIPFSIFIAKESVFKVIESVHIFFAITLTTFFNIYYSWKNHYHKWKSFKNISGAENKPDFILVNKGSKTIPISYNKLAVIQIKDKTLFLEDTERNSYILNKPMDYYHKNLPKTDFYRLNRQVIINKTYIKYFENIENRKLKVTYGFNGVDEETVISQKKSSEFKNWYTQT